jgi:hypothetical protein
MYLAVVLTILNGIRSQIGRANLPFGFNKIIDIIIVIPIIMYVDLYFISTSYLFLNHATKKPMADIIITHNINGNVTISADTLISF